MDTFAPHAIDMYKFGHGPQYYKNTSLVYSNVTARSGKHCNIKNSRGIVVIGIQLLVKDYLIDSWNRTFFSQPEEKVIKKFQRRMSNTLNQEVTVKEMTELHRLGYLPIEIKALPEGSFVPYKVPFITVFNTIKDPKWKWVTNYIDCVLNQEIWPMITSATTMREYLRVFYEFAHHTCEDDSFVKYQGHDFSYRGLPGREAAAKSGFAVIAAGTVGSDTVLAADVAEDYYNADSDKELVISSVNATEHSVMCSNINIIENSKLLDTIKKEFFSILPKNYVDEINDPKNKINVNKLVSEYQYVKIILTEIYPTGNISIVADSYDFFAFVRYIMFALKDIIIERQGKVIVRPDSGDPVDIICGTLENRTKENVLNETEVTKYTEEEIGLIESLFRIFGGTINSKGFIELNSHVGAIYGDSITLERQNSILTKLFNKGFASNNIVLGIGSFTFQYVTRDTHSIAMKATYCEVTEDNETLRIPIAKDPKTDSGKKSAKGLLMVEKIGQEYSLVDECSWKQEQRGCLETVFKDGKIIKETSLQEIRARVKEGLDRDLRYLTMLE